MEAEQESKIPHNITGTQNILKAASYHHLRHYQVSTRTKNP